MTLFEILEQYRYRIKFQSPEKANQFLEEVGVEKSFMPHIQGAFDSNGSPIRADGSFFYWKY